MSSHRRPSFARSKAQALLAAPPVKALLAAARPVAQLAAARARALMATPRVRALRTAPRIRVLRTAPRIKVLLGEQRHQPALAAALTGAMVVGLSVTVLAVRGSAADARASAHEPRIGMGTAPAVTAVTPGTGHSPTGAAAPTSPPPGSATTAPPGPASPSATSSVHPSAPVIGLTGSQNTTGSQAVALTFDDGPDPKYTPVVLDILKEYGVKATFCVVGRQARDHPDLIRRIHDEGHTLCAHSWQHLIDLGQRPHGYQDWDFDQTNKAIRAAVPDAEIKYFRAPGGNFTQGLIDLAKVYGMTPLGWSVDPKDWDAKHHGTGDAMVSHIVTAVQQHTRAGSIVLSHDRAHPDTPTAYRTLLPWLKERYQLIPLP